MNASNGSKKPAKRARVDEASCTVTVFNGANPVNIKDIETVDYRKIDEEERQQDIKRRLEIQQLSPERTGRLSNNQQAFHFLQIPVVVDSKLLTVAELKAELKVRGLKVTGTKEQLVRRLDRYIKEEEPKRVKE